MIKSKEELMSCLKYEKSLYIPKGRFSYFKLCILRDSEYLLWHYVKMLRYTEYYYNTGKRLFYLFYQMRKNVEGEKLGISIYHNSFDVGLRIYHYGNIVINSNARIGKNCKLHGNNCIGNKGDKNPYDVPHIGNDLDMGFGAIILGGINLGNNVIVGANAVVNKSCTNDGAVLIGIPATEIRS